MKDGAAMNRRAAMRSLGQLTAFSALFPWSFGSGGPLLSGSSVLTDGAPGDVGMCSERLEDVFARLDQRIQDGRFPGATALVARHGKIVGLRASGKKLRNSAEQMTVDTLFDVESMTKVVATSASVLVLVHRGVLHLDDKVATYLPDFAANGKGNVTIRDMLRYSAGLPVDNHFLDNPDDAAVWRLMAETPLEYAPGSQVLYSDLTYRLLGRLVEAASGKDLNTFARDHIWGPLGMNDTMFNPPASLLPRIAATGKTALRDYVVRGEVQDDQDFLLGGITGCDGVFTTARDLAIFCQMMLNKGSYDGAQILSSSLTKKMVQNQTPQVTAGATDVSLLSNLLLTPKGLGWELATNRFSTAGMRFSEGSYGKTGGAGTFMWVDPVRKIIAILLTNHGLPMPLDEPGWNSMIASVHPGEFFDGVINAVRDVL